MQHAITLSELLSGVVVGGGLMVVAYFGLKYLAEATRRVCH